MGANSPSHQEPAINLQGFCLWCSIHLILGSISTYCCMMVSLIMLIQALLLDRFFLIFPIMIMGY